MLPRSLPVALAILAVVACAVGGCVAPGAARPPTPTLVSPDELPPPTATPRPPPQAMPSADLISVTGQGVPPNVLDEIAVALRQGAPAVCDALGIACDFPVTVEVFADQAAFDRDVMNPAMRGYFALSGDGRIQMVSPISSGRSELTYDDGVGVAVHEFVHLALDQIAPELPDWLEEGTAVYLAPHEVYDSACRERLVGVALPSLEQMREQYADVPAADLFAYTLVASIVATDGLDGLNALLRAPDDLEQVLGRPVADVERAWREFTVGGCAVPSGREGSESATYLGLLSAPFDFG